ncbi:hypothetical protein [Mangrovactinospora gilvigrisea]
MNARALAALAANPGCRRRALLDGAGVDKGAVAERLGAPMPFGQSQFALVRGNGFEARVRSDGWRALLAAAGAPEGVDAWLPELVDGAAGAASGAAEERLRLTREALVEARGAAAARGAWSVLDHPLLELEVAGAPARLEPDAVLVRPDGRVQVAEVKSFPVLDGSADPAKVGAAARQAAVYVLALREVLDADVVADEVLLLCPKDFSNRPVGAAVDVRRQVAVTRRQLRRMARLEEIAAELPEELTFDLRLRPAPDGSRRQVATRDPEELRAAVEAVPASFAPECLADCELAAHCRADARGCGSLESLGRGVRGELGGLHTLEDVRAAVDGEASGEAAELLRAAAAMRGAALAEVRRGV